MSVTIENLDKLERRITLTVPTESIAAEVQSRLRKLSRTVRADGFRPGKVPLSVVAQRYGYSVHNEVVAEQLGKAFSDAAQEAKLRVAGRPHITPKADHPEGRIAFDATFEVYPEVRVGDLSGIEVERVSAAVDEAAIDKTIEVLRKQRRTFEQRPAGEAAQAGDRVTIDFEGKLDGEPFAGNKAEDFRFVIGEGQMLEQFDEAVRAMVAGESKTFPLRFPDDYGNAELAGKEADFLVTLKQIEAQHLPEVDETFARHLDIADGSIETLRADIRRNLEREVGLRVAARNRTAAMDALANASQFDLPKALVQSEIDRMMASAREDLKRRGIKDADKVPLPEDAMRPQAERRVRLGLVIAELVREHKLQAKPEQLQKHIETLAQGYEKPDEFVRFYLSDRERMAGVEAAVMESNVAEYVLSQVRVTDKTLAFDELMSR